MADSAAKVEQVTVQSDERAPAPPRSSGSGLTRKIGGLPAWAWAAIAAGAGLAVYIWRKNKTSTTAAATTATTPGGSACTDVNGNPGYIDSDGNCITSVTASTTTTTGSGGAATTGATTTGSSTGTPGQPCTDAKGNAGVTDRNGNCDTNPQGTGHGQGTAGLLSQLQNLQGQTLAQATQALQAGGYNLTSVEQSGRAGERFASTLTPDQAAAQQSQVVTGVQAGAGKGVTLWINPP